MNHEAIDRMLANEDELIPSSGFVALVMRRIHEEIAAPKPIHFPWKRAIPGLVLGATGLGWSLAEVSRQALTDARLAPAMNLNVPNTAMRPLEGMAWAAAALCISLAIWKLVRRNESSLL